MGLPEVDRDTGRRLRRAFETAAHADGLIAGQKLIGGAVTVAVAAPAHQPHERQRGSLTSVIVRP
jgi:hypothetical protein